MTSIVLLAVCSVVKIIYLVTAVNVQS